MNTNVDILWILVGVLAVGLALVGLRVSRRNRSGQEDGGLKFEKGDRHEWRFRGRLEFQEEQAPQCVAVVGYDHGDPTTLTVELDWLCNPQEAGSISRKLGYWGRNHIWIISASDFSPSIELLGITGCSHEGTRLTVQVAAVEVGVTREPEAADSDFLLSVQLQPSGILALPEIHEHSYTGETRITKVEDGAALVSCSLGELEAAREFQFRDGRAQGDATTVRVQRAVVKGKISVKSGSSLAVAHEEIQKKVAEICRGLSLAYRQPVEPYEFSYLPDPSNKDQRRRSEAVVRRKRPSILRVRKGDELINMRSLRDGGLQKLVSALDRCSADLIGPTIRYLSSSFSATADVGYFMVFAALEALMEECDPNAQIPAAQWKKIEKKLRGAVEEHVPQDYSNSVKRMLPVLRRAPLVDRVQSNAKRLRPRTDDLWPKVGFAAGMSAAIAARNGLVHAGEIDANLGLDLVRVRTFVERLLLKHIGWSDDDVWNWYDQDLKWINSAE